MNISRELVPLKYPYHWLGIKAPCATALSQTNMSTQISFLDLPGEVRNMIYRYALVRKHYITPRLVRESKVALNLLRTNKKGSPRGPLYPVQPEHF